MGIAKERVKAIGKGIIQRHVHCFVCHEFLEHSAYRVIHPKTGNPCPIHLECLQRLGCPWENYGLHRVDDQGWTWESFKGECPMCGDKVSREDWIDALGYCRECEWKSREIVLDSMGMIESMSEGEAREFLSFMEDVNSKLDDNTMIEMNKLRTSLERSGKSRVEQHNVMVRWLRKHGVFSLP